MILALAFAFAILSVFGVLAEKRNTFKAVRECTAYSALYGISNGAVNLFIITLTGLLPNSVIFSSVSAGGIVLTFIISAAIFQEKLSKPQICGYILGTAAVIILNT